MGDADSREESSGPAPATWSDFYQKSDFDLARLIQVSTHYKKYLDMIEAFAPGPRGLEIGTGTGWAALYLSHQRRDITAIDRDPDIIAEAVRLNQRFGGSAKFRTMDLFRLDFESGSFDFAFHQGVMEHFPETEIRRALQEQLRVAPCVVFSVPGANYKKKDFGDERLWTKKAWLEILAPFKIVHMFGFGYTNDGAKFLGALTHHPRYRRRRWAGLLAKLNDRLFAGELGFVITLKGSGLNS
ncbi:MAG: class I SAM-dependent methyltransferase [Candidatus Aminicenantes bacterium]|nr:class I SAM-dependent methyltransferase [Candidatus Aminicenantes bacterium]